jgi:Fur family ferric uptake transcriptional regulator
VEIKMKSSSVQQLILNLLQQEHAHFTAQEVYTHLKPKLPSVNPSTVYRALERLTNSGEISVSDMGTGAVVYEMVGSPPHHHLVCQGCNQVITLEHEMIQPLFDEVENRFHYKLTTHHLILFGYCQECSKKQIKSPFTL